MGWGRETEESLCDGLNVFESLCSPKNSYIEALTFNVMELGSGAFGK